MSYTPHAAGGTFSAACYDLSQHIHAAGYSSSLAVLALAVPDCSASLRLDLVASQGLKRAISQAIRACVRAEDGVYEIGHWEWVCLLPSLPGEAAGHFAMQKIKRATDALYAELNTPGLKPITFGLAFLHGGGDEARELIQSARIALNVAREQGRAMSVYERRMEDDTSAAQLIDGELRAALASNDGIELLLQPVANLATGRWTSAEVAIALKGARGRTFAESEVVQSVMRQGLVAPYLRWLFNNVARARAQLLAVGIDLPLALNLTWRDLEDDELPDLLCQVLALHDCPPERIILELGSGQVQQSLADAARGNLLRLVEAGFCLAMDDFGAGCGDLCALQNLPFGEIKLAPALLRGDDAADGRRAATLAALLRLGQSLSLRVVAQGVDHADVLARLHALAGLHAQGQQISGALPVEAFGAAFHAATPVA